MNNKLKVLTITLALALTISPIVAAQGGGSIFQFGTAAKPLSMGGAFVPVADNYSAVYWNPAGLYRAEGFQIGGMNTQPYSVGGLNYNFGGASYKLGNVAVGGGFGMLQAKMTEPGYNTTYSENVIIGTGAMGGFLSETLPTDIGVSVKRYSFGGATGVGFDVGLLMPLKGGLTLGVSASDIAQTSVGQNYTIPPTYRAGAAYSLSNVTVAGQVDMVNGNTTLRGGVNITPIKQIAIRGGVVKPSKSDMYFTAGAGLKLAGLSINGAWIQSKSELESTIVLSAGFQFGGPTKEAEQAQQAG